jgi:hypothetical protein
MLPCAFPIAQTGRFIAMHVRQRATAAKDQGPASPADRTVPMVSSPAAGTAGFDVAPTNRPRTTTVVTGLLFTILLLWWVAADSSDGSQRRNTPKLYYHDELTDAGEGLPRYYGRWPTFATAKALSLMSRLFDIDPREFFLSPEELNRVPLVVPYAGKSWVSMCSHRGTLDASSDAAGPNDELKRTPLPKGLEQLHADFNIDCADYDVFLSRDGEPMVGAPGSAGTALFGDGTMSLTTEESLAKFNNLTREELAHLDPLGAHVVPLSVIAPAIAAVSRAAMAKEPFSPDGLATRALFSVEPKGNVLGATANSLEALSARVASDASCKKVLRQAKSSAGLASVTLAGLQQCHALTQAVRQGGFAQLLHATAHHFRLNGVNLAGSSAVRIILDVDSTLFSVLCALLPDDCEAAHSVTNIGANRVDAFIHTTNPVSRMDSEITLWFVTELYHAMQTNWSPEGAENAHFKNVEPGTFIIPLKDRWLTHRAQIAARRAEQYTKDKARGFSRFKPSHTNTTDVLTATRRAAIRSKRRECSVIGARNAAHASSAGRGYAKVLVDGRPAPTLPPWVSHLMPSVTYLEQCHAVRPKLFPSPVSATDDSRRQPPVPATSAARQGDEDFVELVTKSGDSLVDPRTFHCWNADDERTFRESIASLRCSHIVSNHPTKIAVAVGLAPKEKRLATAPKAEPATPDAVLEADIDAAAREEVDDQRKANREHDGEGRPDSESDVRDGGNDSPAGDAGQQDPVIADAMDHA